MLPGLPLHHCYQSIKLLQVYTLHPNPVDIVAVFQVELRPSLKITRQLVRLLGVYVYTLRIWEE